ncbi:GAF domain-containing protein [Paraflavitalea soli]|uniref:GAF domain-containing protein n=1 Tax=Paraflavitalea soli TaxID=2315862 RepID=A0A3B7MK91_9BACT|nr:histidine kinase [Paraflavitalea soli]AXY74067.1 GAF domain-containing protein [Paraflavitalea soli]
MNKVLLLLSAILLLRAGTGLSQSLQSSDFAQYTTEQGLSHNGVMGIAEDSTGFLWIATRSGLNRFNGHRFLQYHSTDDASSLPSEELMGVCRLDDHQLAVVGSGVHIVNTKTGQRRNLFIPYKDRGLSFKFNMTLQAIGDAAGNVFVLSRSGFYQFAQDSLVYRFDYYPDSLVAVNHLVFGGKMLELDDHRLLITSIDGLYLYDKSIKDLHKLRDKEIPALARFLAYPRIPFGFIPIAPGQLFVYDPVNRLLHYLDMCRNNNALVSAPWPKGLDDAGWRSRLIAQDDHTFLVTLQQAGLAQIRFDRNHIDPLVISPVPALTAYVCNDLLLDHERRLLVATNKGLLRQRLSASTVQTGRMPGYNQLAEAAFDDVVTLGDKVYAATRGSGLAVYNKTSLQFEKLLHFATANSPGLDNITALLPLQDKTMVVGTATIPFLFYPQTGGYSALMPPDWTPQYWVQNINGGKQDDVWISAHRIYRYRRSTRSFDSLPGLPRLLDAPVAIEEDGEGNIWMARHGLARYNRRLQQYDRYIDSFPFIKIPDKQVAAFTIDSHHTIWISVQNNGLVAYSPQTGAFRHFTKRNGLPHDQLSALYYLNGKLWMAGYSGISSIDINNYEIRNYGPEDGFPAAPVNIGSRFYYDSVDHLLYIGFADVIARFDPSVIAGTAVAPRIFIEQVMTGGGPSTYLPGNAVFTSWNRRQLNIAIGTINFFDGATQRYAYRLADGEEGAWIDLGTTSSFTISGLSPGRHRLEVRVSPDSHRWPAQVATLDINVAGPFWLSTWFMIVSGLVLGWLIYALVLWRTSVARKKEMVNTQMEKLRAEDYKAQFELEQITHYFSTSLAGKRTEDEILSDVAERLIGGLHYEDCIIYLWNRDKTRLVQRAAYGPKSVNGVVKTTGFTVSPGQGIVGHVVTTGKPLVVHDTRKDARYRVDDCFRLSELTVPIIHNGELLGVIDSEHSEAHYFNDRHVKMMTTIATLLGNTLKQLEADRSLQAKQQELAGINEQLAEARLSALQAQMNPHFVFNALNSIKRMILDADNDTASRYLSKFALMIRMTLEHSKETFVTLHDNIQYLKAYLDMERLRFDHTFSYGIDVKESVDAADLLFPSMMIQPLVENAIWHGLLPAEGEKRILVCFQVSDQRLRCIIQDNGIGIRQAEQMRRESRAVHRSVGLENLRKRIHILNEKYHTACTLSITDLREAGGPQTGTRAVLELNIITA